MKKRKYLNIVALVIGITSILMLFVIPFFIPKEIDTKIIARIYFIIFLLFLGISNKAIKVSNKPLTLDEERDQKIKKILKWNFYVLEIIL